MKYYGIYLAMMHGLFWAGQAFAVNTSLSWGDGLQVEFTDDIELSVGMRLQGDAVKFHDDRTTLEDEKDFRRARVTNQLDVEDWRFRADYDFGVSEGWKNLFIQYRGLKNQRITIGNHSAPFSMEDMSSSLFQPLLERSIASALSPGIQLGASYRRWGKDWSATAGIFGDELNDQDRRRLPGKSANLRITHAPVFTQSTTIHLGIAAEFRNIDDGERVRLRVRPGTRLATRRLIDTRNIDDVDSSDTVGLEFAAAHCGFRLQVETARATLDSNQGDLDFDSHYIMASALFGAGDYRYSHSRGVFKSVRPESDWGAVELTARYAQLDLSDRFVTGGKQSEATLGVSWIINSHLRAMLSYTDIETSPNRNGNDEDVSLWSLRLQWAI